MKPATNRRRQREEIMKTNSGMDKEKQFSDSALIFKSEVINLFAKDVRLTLNEPKNLMCMMRVGASRQIPVAGDQGFRLIAAIVTDTGADPKFLKLRIEPVVREEYRFADLLVKEMTGFSGKFVDYRLKDWDSIYNLMLDQPCQERAGVTYREVIEAALVSEKDRILKQNIEAHSDFGSW